MVLSEGISCSLTRASRLRAGIRNTSSVLSTTTFLKIHAKNLPPPPLVHLQAGHSTGARCEHLRSVPGATPPGNTASIFRGEGGKTSESRGLGFRV